MKNADENGADGGFSADWLALRAGADTRARNQGLAARLGQHFKGHDRVQVLDIGAGTGANMRATAPLVAAQQHWVLTDHDPTLLAQVTAPEGVMFETRQVDLAGVLDPLFTPAPDLVTASAFFDLVGEDWLQAFVDRLASAGAALYTVLTYDGRETWAPPHELDEAVLSAFHDDQCRDKGLGPALGPSAPAAMASALRAQGYRVWQGQSDWTLRQPRDSALIAALAEGSGQAVAATLGRERADSWATARRTAAEVLIGHSDLLALPAGP